MKISNINEFKRSFEKLQWLFKTFEAQNFEDLSPMELDFFREVLGRLASTVDVSDIKDVDQSNPAISPSSQEASRALQETETPIEPPSKVDSSSTKVEDTPETNQDPMAAQNIPQKEETKEPANPQPKEEVNQPAIDESKDTTIANSDNTKDNDAASAPATKNVVDQFFNNSPSIADRAQKNIDDSTTHLLRRGGHLSLNSLIDLNRRFLIINDVFGNKRMNFDKEIEFIDNLSDLNSAMNHLNENVVKTYNVNTSTKGFEILKKVITRRFES